MKVSLVSLLKDPKLKAFEPTIVSIDLSMSDELLECLEKLIKRMNSETAWTAQVVSIKEPILVKIQRK